MTEAEILAELENVNDKIFQLELSCDYFTLNPEEAKKYKELKFLRLRLYDMLEEVKN